MQYVLSHGSWHGGWCWEFLAPFLKAKGHSVLPIDLPGHGINIKSYKEVTYADYYNYLEKVILSFSEPIILVAHSMSGIIAVPLAERYPEKVAHLFLIAAWIPHYGRSLMDMALGYNNSEIPKILYEDLENRTHHVDLMGAKEVLYHDCSTEIKEWATSKLQPQPLAPLETPIHWVDSGKNEKKRTYIICQKDRDVNPLAQADMLKCYPSRVIEMNTGHFPFFSHPENLAHHLENFM